MDMLALCELLLQKSKKAAKLNVSDGMINAIGGEREDSPSPLEKELKLPRETIKQAFSILVKEGYFRWTGDFIKNEIEVTEIGSLVRDNGGFIHRKEMKNERRLLRITAWMNSVVSVLALVTSLVSLFFAYKASTKKEPDKFLLEVLSHKPSHTPPLQWQQQVLRYAAYPDSTTHCDNE